MQQLFQKEVSKRNYNYIFHLSLKDIECFRKTNLINFLTNEDKRFCRFRFRNYKKDQVIKKFIQHFTVSRSRKKICIILNDFENENFCIDTFRCSANNCEDLKTCSLLYNILKKINTAYCDKFLGNTLRNLICNNINYILYNVVRRAIATHFDLAQESHQATCANKKHYSIQQKLSLSSNLECTPRLHSKIL